MVNATLRRRKRISFEEDETDESSVNKEESETESETKYKCEEEVEHTEDYGGSLLRLWKYLSPPTFWKEYSSKIVCLCL